MKNLLQICLDDLYIPHEHIEDYGYDGECIRKYDVIPNYNDCFIFFEYDSSDDTYNVEFYRPIVDDIQRMCNLYNVSDREALEYILLYLAQNDVILSERVLYSGKPYDDPEIMVADIIQEGLQKDETPDMIAGKILEKRLIFDVKELVSNTIKKCSTLITKEEN